MLKRILLLLCFAGIAVYSVKIYQLKDKISFTAASNSPTNNELLLMQFYMESDQADLLVRCQTVFNSKIDRITLNPHPSQPQLATLSVERDFQAQQIQSILELQKQLQDQACLKAPNSRFSFGPPMRKK